MTASAGWGAVVAVAGTLAWAAAAEAAAPALTGDYVVDAQRPAYTDVTIPKPLHLFTPSGAPTFVLAGDGAVISAEFREIGRAPSPFGPAAVEFFRLGPPDHRITGYRVSIPGGSDTVPAGTYRLYLQSDRGARAELRIPELTGASEARPTAPVQFAGGLLPNVDSPDPFTTIFGASAGIARTGDLTLWADFTAPAGSPGDTYEICRYGGAVTTPGAYGPGCPGGTATPFAQSKSQQGVALLYQVTNVSPGTYGLGVNLTHPGPAPTSAAAAYWAGFADDEPPLFPDEPAGRPSRPSEPPAPTGQAGLARTRLRLVRHRVEIVLRCDAEGPCRGWVGLSRGGRHARFRMAQGTRAVLRVRPPRDVLRALRRRRTIHRTVLLVQGPSGKRSLLRFRCAIVR